MRSKKKLRVYTASEAKGLTDLWKPTWESFTSDKTELIDVQTILGKLFISKP